MFIEAHGFGLVLCFKITVPFSCAPVLGDVARIEPHYIACVYFETYIVRTKNFKSELEQFSIRLF